ncbi:MAG: Tic20 family protein [Cyanobacteriota bacterium]|nr:Tic20 family protein [Cyanobacteriota bacterium]
MQDPPIWQRLASALVYLLPWSDALEFGRSLFALFPPLQWAAVPAIPLLQLQQAVPFGGLVLFLVLFLAVVRNSNVPYLVRFHALQAILLDIVLVLLGLAFGILLAPLGPNFAVRTLQNTVFLGALLLVLFSVVQSLRGKEADIPTVSEAVRMQLF